MGDFEKPLNFHFDIDCSGQQINTKAEEEKF